MDMRPDIFRFLNLQPSGEFANLGNGENSTAEGARGSGLEAYRLCLTIEGLSPNDAAPS